MHNYSVGGYFEMMNDRPRMAAYESALRAAIQPGCLVVNIGAGAGLMSFLACRLGASRVFAIEPADIIEVARGLAVANGFADRIEFIQDLSTRVELPQRADVVVADLRGVLPWYEHNIASMIDARNRLLAPGGALIPNRDRLWLGVVEAGKVHGRLTKLWQQNDFGLNIDAAKRLLMNKWLKERAEPEQLVSQPQCVAVLDYCTVEDIDLKTSANCIVARSTIAHGFNLWFDGELSDSASFSTGPSQPELIYGQGFFPWLEPVTLSEGDEVAIVLQARFVEDDYVWCWDTTIKDGATGQVKGEFKQSTFFGVPLSPANLRKRASVYVPTLSEDGSVDQFVLGMMDGRRTLAEIAGRVAERFPNRFRREEDVLAHVGELSKRYSR